MAQTEELDRLNALYSEDDKNPSDIRAAHERLMQMLPQLQDPYAKKTIAATSLTLRVATDILGIKYKLNAMILKLKKDREAEIQVSHCCATMIESIKWSQYHHACRGEALSRIIIDLILCDRLLALDDSNANKNLQVASEVDIRAELTDISQKVSYDAGFVTGRADYVLSYGGLKSSLENALVVIEAKKEGFCSTALTQTLCYLVGIQNARKRAGKINIEVFGIMADIDEFRFVLLDNQRTAFVSRPQSWIVESGCIVAFLDCILRAAIESSPNTTPVKINNKQIKQYGARLKEYFDMVEIGGAVTLDMKDDQGEGQQDEGKGEIEGYDVVLQDGKTVLVLSSGAEQKLK